jgi:hypothetical protein
VSKFKKFVLTLTLMSMWTLIGVPLMVGALTIGLWAFGMVGIFILVNTDN